VNPVVWSLTNEVVFYLVFPFVVPVFLRRPGAALAASLAASLLWRAGATNLQGLASLASVDVPEWLPRHLFRQAPAYAFTFAAGMYAATVHAGRAGHPFFSSRRALALHGLSAAVVLGGLHVAGKGAALAASPVYQDYLRDLVPSAAFALWLTLASNAAPAIRGAYETSVGRFLGHVAYGVFLWHMPVMHVVWALVEPGELGLTRGTWTVVALVVPVSILSGWLSYRFLEQPLLRFLAWRQRERRRARKDAQEAPLVPRPAAG
jgi:peptidoglycan/LPS O-acetylase OafA/YrhL